jgi:hypothetical protein
MVDTFRTNDITPEVRAHMERESQWYGSGGKGPMPRDWEPPTAHQRERAAARARFDRLPSPDPATAERAAANQQDVRAKVEKRPGLARALDTLFREPAADRPARTPSAAERARASLASDPPPRSDEELTRQVKERERAQARSLVARPARTTRAPRGTR